MRSSSARGADLPSLALARRESGPSREHRGIEAQLALDSPRATVERARKRFDLGGHRLDGLRADLDPRGRRIEMDMTCNWFEIAGDKAEQCGLASAVGADHAGPSGRERERHVSENRNGIGVRKRETR